MDRALRAALEASPEGRAYLEAKKKAKRSKVARVRARPGVREEAEALSRSVSAAREEGRREGIEEAAREADSEAVLYRESADALDGQGNHGSAYGDIHGALACDAVAKRIRALAEKTETKP